MIKKDTIHAYAWWEVVPTEVAQREEKKIWTNCSSVVLMSFRENWKIVRVLVKKSRIWAEKIEEVREEYRKLRYHLGDIIPLQAFITEKREDYWGREMVSAFCSPVTIAYDIFASAENFEFLKRELDQNQDLQNDIDLFISGYRKLKDVWFHIDLWWDENLIITREWRLKYIDSFVIDMTWRKSLLPLSEARFVQLEALMSL